MNVLAIVKQEHRYVFVYDDESIPKLRKVLAEYAADGELDFSWLDAIRLEHRLRQIEHGQVEDD